jgi:hypothetical protein
MIPTIHLNGTSREELIRQLQQAVTALTEAHRALENAAPHGRDYYPQGKGAIQQAVIEHRERLMRLGDIQEEILAILDVIEGVR